MIKHIDIEGFKSFEKVSLDLGGLNIFIGTNASGKSNFFDVLRVLQGIGYGFTIDEIFNGKPKSAISEVWEPIRGGLGNAAYRNLQTGLSPASIRLAAQLVPKNSGQELTYSVSLGAGTDGMVSELFKAGDETVFHETRDAGAPGVFDHSLLRSKKFFANRPITQRTADYVEAGSRALSDMQIVDPSPMNLRDYSRSSNVRRMGERGEEFAGLVHSITKDKRLHSEYLSWLKELTPAEFDEVEPVARAIQDFLFAVKKGGHSIPAPILSDGTLRFASIAAAFFQPDMPDRILIEEIENGLHPTRLRLLIELLKSQSATGFPQVLATSHSPILLDWLKEDDFKHVFLCKRDDETGASTITPLSELPRFMDLIRKQPASELFAEGWLESAA